MAVRSPDHFDIDHQVRSVGGRVVLRLVLDLRLAGPGGVRQLTFRVDTGADVSVIPEPVAVALGLRPEGGLTVRSASGVPMRGRWARGVRYEFDRFSGLWFRSDFVVSPDLKSRDSLLAWRDLALDFDIRTTALPNLQVGPYGAFGRPGTVRFTLRSDRDADRVG